MARPRILGSSEHHAATAVRGYIALSMGFAAGILIEGERVGDERLSPAPGDGAGAAVDR